MENSAVPPFFGAAMKLKSDWKDIVEKAWSFRLMTIAALLTAAEVALPLFADEFERGTLAMLSGLVIVGAMVARLLVQKEMKADD